MGNKQTKAERKRTLNDLIEKLPGADIDRDDIKQLALQLILDTSDDTAETKAARGKLKLDGLKLLADMLRDEDTAETDDALLGLLAGDEGED
jgi:hypothetical protein